MSLLWKKGLAIKKFKPLVVIIGVNEVPRNFWIYKKKMSEILISLIGYQKKIGACLQMLSYSLFFSSNMFHTYDIAIL